jgi:hypothetical protein
MIAVCFMLGLNLEDGGDMFIIKTWVIFNGLHDVMSQKIEIFITTSV